MKENISACDEAEIGFSFAILEAAIQGVEIKRLDNVCKTELKKG